MNALARKRIDDLVDCQAVRWLRWANDWAGVNNNPAAAGAAAVLVSASKRGCDFATAEQIVEAVTNLDMNPDGFIAGAHDLLEAGLIVQVNDGFGWLVAGVRPSDWAVGKVGRAA